ncbi:energy transducer TonB [Dongia sp.]|uniref:energy transducer TonB n=1 Tax=Dongia sp. TaxID=1977262 RepID=UPI0035B3FBF1
MSLAVQSLSPAPGREAPRWALAGMLMAGLHVGAAAAGILYWHRPPTEMILPPATIIAFELAPAPVAPPPPPRVEDMPEIEPVIDPPPPITELDIIPPAPPEVKVAVAVPEKPKPVKKKKKQEKKKKKKIEKPVEAPVPPQEFKTASDAPSTTQVESAPQPVTAAAPVAAGPTPDDVARVSEATNRWELAFRKHIEKYRRYPKSARRKHQEGSPVVNFVFDRSGEVIEVRVTRSSGVDVLDDEAIATFQRASPLPPLPPEIEGSRLQRTIALNFSLK